MELETTKQNYFTYKTEELLIELLRGIRIDTLDRMIVTIIVTVVKENLRVLKQSRTGRIIIKT